MTNTIKTTESGDPILTWELRYTLTDALVEMIENPRGYGDPASYLSTLQHTPPETVITADHELADALTFFGLFEY